MIFWTVSVNCLSSFVFLTLFTCVLLISSQHRFSLVFLRTLLTNYNIIKNFVKSSNTQLFNTQWRIRSSSGPAQSQLFWNTLFLIQFRETLLNVFSKSMINNQILLVLPHICHSYFKGEDGGDQKWLRSILMRCHKCSLPSVHHSKFLFNAAAILWCIIDLNITHQNLKLHEFFGMFFESDWMINRRMKKRKNDNKYDTTILLGLVKRKIANKN